MKPYNSNASLSRGLSRGLTGGFAGLALLSAPPAQPAAAEPSRCGPISARGHRLETLFDGLGVESRWLVDEHINWETGEPDKGADYDGPGRSTHCSAFAAAVGKKLGIYLLRPPDHGQILLANAQAEWFHTDKGRVAGWRSVAGPWQAQTLANEGNLVVIVYDERRTRAPIYKGPGTSCHCASRAALRAGPFSEDNGPSIIQAGTKNYTNTSTKVGFVHHPGAWPHGVQYYTHAVDGLRL